MGYHFELWRKKIAPNPRAKIFSVGQLGAGYFLINESGKLSIHIWCIASHAACKLFLVCDYILKVNQKHVKVHEITQRIVVTNKSIR